MSKQIKFRKGGVIFYGVRIKTPARLTTQKRLLKFIKQVSPEGIFIFSPLNKTSISLLLGVNYKTVYDYLNQLRKSGWLKKLRKNVYEVKYKKSQIL